MEISKDPETGQVVTISRILLPALKREQHGSELSCEVDSTTLSKRKTVLMHYSSSPRLFTRARSFPCG